MHIYINIYIYIYIYIYYEGCVLAIDSFLCDKEEDIFMFSSVSITKLDIFILPSVGMIKFIKLECNQPYIVKVSPETMIYVVCLKQVLFHYSVAQTLYIISPFNHPSNAFFIWSKYRNKDIVVGVSQITFSNALCRNNFCGPIQISLEFVAQCPIHEKSLLVEVTAATWTNDDWFLY